MSTLYIGNIVHSKSYGCFETFANGYVAVKDGKITSIGSDHEKWKNSTTFEQYEEIQLLKTQFLMPGFIDCHCHASQMPNIGLGLDKSLLEWLDEYTFPLEAQYEDQHFAAKVYADVVKNTICNGTTLATYFATISKESSLILAKEAIRQGQRAFVGKVSSNCNCPSYYVETSEGSLEENIDFLKKFSELNGGDLVQPIITPRFAITCSENLMKDLAKLAKKNNLNIQTHISENEKEVELAESIFQGKSYALTYADCGLLTKKTILAHGVHLNDLEIEIIKKHGSSIAHCPLSNLQLSSGLCDVKRLLEAGICVGLGTDISGGNKASVQDALLRALDVSHFLYFAKTQEIKGTGKISDDAKSKSYTPLDYKQAFYLATLGGAEALAVSDKLGNFTVGKEFDALLIETLGFPIFSHPPKNIVDANKNENDFLLEMVQKFIYVGDDRNILKVFVQGKRVK